MKRPSLETIFNFVKVGNSMLQGSLYHCPVASQHIGPSQGFIGCCKSKEEK
jgi:hypothetical protein